MDTTSPQALVATAVTEAMEAAGLSTKALAETTSIPRVTLIRRLRGISPFTVAELAAIAEALNCHPTDFYRDAA